MTVITNNKEAGVGQPSYIVWSNEHRSFWAPNRCGYTGRIEKAGRYTKEQAETICRGANYRANTDLRSGTPPEIYMPAPEALDAMADLRAACETAFDFLGGVDDASDVRAQMVSALTLASGAPK
jgi:hypothetical protein